MARQVYTDYFWPQRTSAVAKALAGQAENTEFQSAWCPRQILFSKQALS